MEEDIEVQLFNEIDIKMEEEISCGLCGKSEEGIVVACENCDQWFHWGCAGMKEEDSVKIIKYFCVNCQDKQPSARKDDTLTMSGKRKAPEAVEPTQGIQGERRGPKSKKTAEGLTKRIKKNIPDIDSSTFELGDEAASGTEEKKGISDASGAKTISENDNDSVHTEQNQRKGPKRKTTSQWVQTCRTLGCIKPTQNGSEFCGIECGLKTVQGILYGIIPEEINECLENEDKVDYVPAEQSLLEVQRILNYLKLNKSANSLGN